MRNTPKATANVVTRLTSHSPARESSAAVTPSAETMAMAAHVPVPDVPLTQTFGPNTLVSFKVWTDELV